MLEGVQVKTGRKLGLVAGSGKLPGVLAQSARERGYDVIGFALSDEAVARISPHCEKVHTIYPGQIGRNIKLIRQEGCKEMVFIGKVPKLDMLKQITKLDWTAVRELSKLSDFSDDSIQLAIGELCEAHGVRVLTQSEFLRHIFPNVGVLTKRQPTAAEYADVDYGFAVAKEIARLDIGQTVIVQDRIIMAIEAAEGTDHAIKRAVSLARGPVCVCKVSKPNQDQRFDIPAVGMNTLEAMFHEKRGGVLAIEANATMVVEQSEMAEFADANGISIVAV